MFKRRAASELKKAQVSDDDVDHSGRTYNSVPDLERIRRASSSSESDGTCHSLDGCVHTAQEVRRGLSDVVAKRWSLPDLAVKELSVSVEKRLSLQTLDSRSNSPLHRQVSFLDEELGLTPRHVITETHYRPRTTEEERHELYYNSNDFNIFEQEDIYEKIEAEIQQIEEQKRLADEGGELIVTAADGMNLKNLMIRLQEISSQSTAVTRHAL
jgi:hypothetical protein